jgi:hypothetical protein
MAKTDKDFSIPEKLGNLYKLQLYVSEIDGIRNLRGELPQEVADMEDGINELTSRMSRVRADIEAADNKIKEMQENIAKAEALIDQYTRQQDDVKNNKEYEFLTKEIEYQNLEIELSNKRIRESMETIENLQMHLDDSMHELEDRRADLDIKKGELDEIIAETRNEEEMLREKAKKLENSIDPKLLATFKRIHKKALNGLAIVPIEEGACGGCFNRITPQRQVDVKMHKKIIVCEYCGRILIDDELAKENNIRRPRKGVLNQLT